MQNDTYWMCPCISFSHVSAFWNDGHGVHLVNHCLIACYVCWCYGDIWDWSTSPHTNESWWGPLVLSWGDDWDTGHMDSVFFWDDRLIHEGSEASWKSWWMLKHQDWCRQFPFFFPVNLSLTDMNKQGNAWTHSINATSLNYRPKLPKRVFLTPGPKDPESPTPFFCPSVCPSVRVSICASRKIKIFCCHWFHILISWVLGNVGTAVLMVLSDFPFGLTVVMKKPKELLFVSLLSCTSFVPSFGIRNICHRSRCSHSSAGLINSGCDSCRAPGRDWECEIEEWTSYFMCIIYVFSFHFVYNYTEFKWWSYSSSRFVSHHWQHWCGSLRWNIGQCLAMDRIHNVVR